MLAADIAQPPPVETTAENDWTFSATPYLWLAGLNGQVGVRGQPPTDVDVDFSQIFDAIDWFPPPIMIVGEARNGRFALFTDFIYLGLEADGSSSGVVPLSADVEMNTVVWTFGASYRVVENDSTTLDLLAGGRLWYVDMDVTLTGPAIVRQDSGSKTWVDPIVGMAGTVALGNGFGLHAEADIGGFGVGADLDWQALGTLQYRYNDSVTLEAGYRYLDVDYDNDGFVFDVAMHGPIIGASFRF
ncbi:hypothetical protein ABLE71_16600 [Mesorhizobium sp. KR9-304]